MDITPKVKPQEAPRDPRFNPPGQVKTINGSIVATHTLGSLALILTALSEDGTKIDCKVYDILAKKFSNVKASARQWYHSRLNWKLGATSDQFLQSDVRLVHMLCLKKDGTLDEKALATCMKEVVKMAKYEKGSVHISAALIEQVPELQAYIDNIKDTGVSVYLYAGDAKKEEAAE